MGWAKLGLEIVDWIRGNSREAQLLWQLLACIQQINAGHTCFPSLLESAVRYVLYVPWEGPGVGISIPA